MNPYSDHAAGIAELVAEMGDDCPSIVYGGATIKVLPSDARTAGKNSVGGLALESDLQVCALLADFPTTPASNKTFTHNGKTYRIADVTFDAARLVVQIAANDAAQSL